MTFEDILHHASVDAKLTIDDQTFSVSAIEKVRLASGDRVVWMWSAEGQWLVVDDEGDEIILLTPAEEEVEEGEDEFITYRGDSYGESYEDTGTVSEIEGEVDHEEEVGFELREYESDRGDLVRKLVFVGAGDDAWFFGKMVEEDDVRVV